MRITVISVGKLKESFWKDAIAEYVKRLGAFADVRLLEVPDRDPSSLGDRKALSMEATDILKVIPTSSYVIALDVAGKQLSSEKIASAIDLLGVNGTSHITFLVGGSLGLAPEVLATTQERWSFGPITLPHNLARVVLVEQLYRAFKISRNEPYHK